jgi:hypothetical protein
MAEIDFIGEDRFKCGATNRMSFGFANLTDPQDPESALIPDATYLVGKTARLQIRWKHTDEVALVTATTEDGKITLDAPEGRVDIVIPPEDTELLTLKERTAVYDLEIVDGALVDRPAQGSVLLDPNVTRTGV